MMMNHKNSINVNENEEILKLTAPLSPTNVSSTIINLQKSKSFSHDLYNQFDDLTIDHNSIDDGFRCKNIIYKTNKGKRNRERVKSFIEFDDDLDFNSNNITGTVANQCAFTVARKKFNRRSLASSGEYRNELIGLFDQYNQNNSLAKSELNKEQNDLENKNQEEWNDFQTSNDFVETKNVQPNGSITSNEISEPDLDFNTNKNKDEEETDTEVEDEMEKYEDGEQDISDPESTMLYSRLNKMEQEQELLNNSLLALTSHFAQVQLRLKQIVDAKDLDAKKRESLLMELETFANRGIPDLMLYNTPNINHLERSASMATSLMADDVFDDDNDNDVDNHIDNNNEQSTSFEQQSIGSCSRQFRSSWSECDSVNTSGNYKLNSNATSIILGEKLERQRHKQKELITQLKDQLEDLERYAYETGELNSLPSSMLLERQNAIIEQLKSKLPILSIDEIDQLSPDELRRKVDIAIKELVNPVIMKEQLVSQLKTQVTDLERFIEFLQKGGGKMKMKNNSTSSKYFMNFLKKQKNSSFNENIKKQNSKTNPELNILDEKSSTIKLKHKTNINTNTNTNANANIHNNNVNKNTTMANIFKRIVSLLQVFAWTQLGTTELTNKNKVPINNYKYCGKIFEPNLQKRTTISGSRHWGDLRANLEMAIAAIIEFYKQNNMFECNKHSKTNNKNKFKELKTTNENEINHEPDDEAQNNNNNNNNNNNENNDFIALGRTTLVIDNYFLYEQMTILVRKQLAISLRNLIQHGLIGCRIDDESNSLLSLTANTSISTATTIGNIISLGFGCFSNQKTPIINVRPVHAWELIIYYYRLKNGNKFRLTPSRRLSQSFGLQAVSGCKIDPKQSLLIAIDDIIESHTHLKRSLDSHFKAFVSFGLNQQMLSQWLRLMLRNPTIVKDCYEKWSYAASTGFEDVLRQLDKLSNLKFCLPTDLAVRQLQSIHDAF